MTFTQLGLRIPLVEALEKEGITTPTNIQNEAIPLILENKDVIGQSETGTGKTLAYLLPIFEKADPSRREAQVIILTPTHELAFQVQKEVEQLANHSGIEVNSLSIIGNVSITRQVDQLKTKPQIIVGSPGRILELITMRKIKAHTVKTIVIDEADRLLDKTNLEVVQSVIKTTQKDRQLLLFSATITDQTLQIAQALLNNPKLLRVQNEIPLPDTITHLYFVTDLRDKIEVFRKVYHILKPEKAIVFINQNYEVEKTVERLKYHGLIADGIHGTSVKLDRKKVMDHFRSGKIPILVASDLAARGLDIEGVTHIFNLDLPEDTNLYLHRAGRTGRAGKSGHTISIVTESEQKIIRKCENRFGITISLKDTYNGKIVEPRTRRRSGSSQLRKPINQSDKAAKPHRSSHKPRSQQVGNKDRGKK